MFVCTECHSRLVSPLHDSVSKQEGTSIRVHLGKDEVQDASNRNGKLFGQQECKSAKANCSGVIHKYFLNMNY